MDNKINIPFSPPDIGEAEIANVIGVLRSGWITTGPQTKLFEKSIAKYCGTDMSVCLNSATACLELTLLLFGIGRGDEVITSAYTYTASASVIHHVGAKIVLVDTMPDSYEMDYDALENAVTARTKAIIPVDIAGVMCDYDKIMEIVNRKKSLFAANNDMQASLGRILVLADAAHSFGATYKGKRAGTLADFTSFSFHAVKNLTTAEGGAVTWKNIDGVDNETIYKKYMLMSLHGQSKDALAKTQIGAWEYDIVAPYFKCNMTDIMAAIGLAQLDRYDELLAKRKKIINLYDTAFNDTRIKALAHYGKDGNSCGHLYLTRVKGAGVCERNKIIENMALAGIACNVHYKPLPMHTAYKNLGFDVGRFPNAFAQYENEITLPLHTKLSDEHVSYIIENYLELAKKL